MKRRKQKFLKSLIPFFFIGYSNAYCQTWEVVATSEIGDQHFVDPGSIVRTGSQVSFTQLSNHPKGMPYNSQIVYSVITFRVADCAQHTYRWGYLIGYSKTKAEGGIELVDLNKKTGWVKTKPKSMASFMEDRVCLE